MFIGTWLINLIFGFGAFLLVFIGSMTTNTAQTSFIRAIFAFAFFYVIIYLFRWLWMLAFKDLIND